MSASVERRIGRFAERTKRAKENASRRLAAFRASRVWRTWLRFSNARGLLLARGLAFQALLAVFATLWLTFALLGVWLRSEPDVLDALVTWLNALVPNLIDVGEGGAVAISQLLSVGTLGWTGGVAALVLVWTAVSWFSSAREGVRAVAGLPRRPGNPILLRLRDAVVALFFCAAMLLATVLTAVSTGAIGVILDWFGATASGLTEFFTGAAGLVLGYSIHTVLMYVFLRYLADVAFPFRDLLQAALLGAFGFVVLEALGGYLVSRTGSNPLLTSFAVVLGLLFWFYLLCIVLLVVTAWAAESRPRAAKPTDREG